MKRHRSILELFYELVLVCRAAVGRHDNGLDARPLAIGTQYVKLKYPSLEHSIASMVFSLCSH